MTQLRFSGAVLAIVAVGALLGAREQAAPKQASQEKTIAEPSLGDLARRARAEGAKQSKAVKVFTNTDLPTAGGISVVGAPASSMAAQPGMEPMVEPVAEQGESEHGETYYVRTMNKLEARLTMHQRELAVLQQKLNLAEPQFYTDANKALMQQYSRSDINQLQTEIEAKQQQIAGDERAIADLRQQLQRQGGDPGWLRPGALAAGRAQPEAEEQAPPAPSAGAKEATGTRAYWQARFKAARERLKNAEEEQQLAEDELSLLETRQINEQAGQTQLAPEVSAKQVEVEKKRAATARARAALAALEAEFKESGVPEEWIKSTD